MKKVFFAALLAAFALPPAGALADDPLPRSQPVAFDGKAGVIELRGHLQTYQPSGEGADKALWYVFTAANAGETPAVRVLRAGRQPGLGLGLMPRSVRPAAMQVASDDPSVSIERVADYGRHSYRIVLPPGATAALAVKLRGAAAPPSLLAWTEPALAAHNRWQAIFVAAVAGLIAAAAAIAAGLAALSGGLAARWAAFALIALVLTRLADFGLFDDTLATPIGGPYGLTAMFAGLALAAGLRFVDAVLPFAGIWPAIGRMRKWVLFALVGLALGAGLGLPGAALLIDALCVIGAVAVAAHAFWRNRAGAEAAGSLLPAAWCFALMGLTAAAFSLGLFGDNPLMPDIAGAFAAAGAVLLGLCVAAGEGIRVPMSRQSASTMAAPDSDPAEEAIGAALQGRFEYDIARDVVLLSGDAAVLVGLGERAVALDHGDWMARIHPDDLPIYEQALRDFGAESGLAFRIEFRVPNRSGRTLWFELRATMKGRVRRPASRCVGLIADVTTRKQSEASMLDRAVRDPLTGLGNRVALMEEMDNLADADDVVCVLIDIDRFKSIHASLGDAGGDRVLAGLARRLADAFAGEAQIFRVGGDSFALLAAAHDRPRDLGERAVKLCESPHDLGGRNVYAKASAGVALGRDAGDPLGLIGNAELALRLAKRDGGNCARVYAAGMAAPADAVALEADLRHALESGAIELHYQPIVRLRDRTVAGFEALMRWRHPTKGLLSSDAFIKHAEESGLIVELGRYALKRAGEDLAGWQRYFPLPEMLFVSVNLSRRQLADEGFEDFLAELLRFENLAAGSLVLELTESAVAGNEISAARLDRIRALGVRLAIDDFGAGMSSLGALRDLPFDIIKFDKSFLGKREAGQDGVILSSMVTMARDLGRKVVVEGVESEADAQKLDAMGCDLAQGFLFAEALPLSDALKYIARHFRAKAQGAG